MVSRRQVLDCSLDSAYVRRMLRRRAWVSVFDGVYVTHTGPLTWMQRAWCALLHTWPSALSHRSAWMLFTGKGSTAAPIHVAVDARRNLRPVDGIVVHYRSDYDAAVVTTVDPPRVRLEQTVIDLAAAAASTVEVIAVLSDAVGSRRTTATRLLTALDARCRTRNGGFIKEVLHDVHAGTCSVLEHEYLTTVERAHGLPAPLRQAPTGVGRSGFRDLDYPEWGVVVELDGRLGHADAVSRDLDMERDLDAAVHADRRTYRIGYGQVHDRACSTAEKIAIGLRKGGWAGRPHACRSPSCILLRAA
ncbi:hypothetical protein nbrc107696_44870 [Gordonia spumicola]|uniref:AbiEi antitoxin C-terminal domain-containing protein n=1 Tax=Gordonia spumicola TaxID=589161 RepID=A0A7I9VG18_9ACTN|nr:hypothetical protein nbrc107696_44870 [Gordonia spumicola]